MLSKYNSQLIIMGTSMSQGFVLTVISDDKPGIVEKIAGLIQRHDGNWLESNLSYLGGKFAGIVEYSVDESRAQALEQALKDLRQQGLTIVIEPSQAETSAPATHKFSIVGNDRPGIIRELSFALAQQGINVMELNSECSSAPHTGTPLFEAWGTMSVPAGTDIVALQEGLEKLCDQLAVDLQFESL